MLIVSKHDTDVKGPRLPLDRPERVFFLASTITNHIYNYISGRIIAGPIIDHVDGDGNVRHSYITVHFCLKKKKQHETDVSINNVLVQTPALTKQSVSPTLQSISSVLRLQSSFLQVSIINNNFDMYQNCDFCE